MYAEVAMNRGLIKSRIKTLGLKQVWLAAELNIHQGTLSRFLTGRTMLGGEELVRLLQILNLDTEALKKKAS